MRTLRRYEVSQDGSIVRLTSPEGSRRAMIIQTRTPFSRILRTIEIQDFSEYESAVQDRWDSFHDEIDVDGLVVPPGFDSVVELLTTLTSGIPQPDQQALSISNQPSYWPLETVRSRQCSFRDGRYTVVIDETHPMALVFNGVAAGLEGEGFGFVDDEVHSFIPTEVGIDRLAEGIVGKSAIYGMSSHDIEGHGRGLIAMAGPVVAKSIERAGRIKKAHTFDKQQGDDLMELLDVFSSDVRIAYDKVNGSGDDKSAKEVVEDCLDSGLGGMMERNDSDFYEGVARRPERVNEFFGWLEESVPDIAARIVSAPGAIERFIDANPAIVHEAPMKRFARAPIDALVL